MKSLIIRFILDPLIDWSVTLKFKWTIKKQLEEMADEDMFFFRISEYPQDDRTIH